MAMRFSFDWHISNVLIAVLAVPCVAMAFFSWLVFSAFGDRGCWELTMEEWDYTADCWDAWTVGSGSAGISAFLAIGIVVCLYFGSSRTRYVVLLGAASLTACLISALLTLKVLVSLGDAGCLKSETGTETVRAECMRPSMDLWMVGGIATVSFVGFVRSLFIKSRSDDRAESGHV